LACQSRCSKIVGYYLDSGHVNYGFLYSGGTYTTLDDPSASHAYDDGTVAAGINREGDIVGYYLDQTGTHGFLAIPEAITGVPESSTWAMMLIGFAGLGFAFSKWPSGTRKASAGHVKPRPILAAPS
jgi:hypothetical protein